MRGAPAIPIKVRLDSFGNLPVHKMIPEVLRLYELPREEYESLCNAPTDMEPLTFDYTSEYKIYNTEYSIQKEISNHYDLIKEASLI